MNEYSLAKVEYIIKNYSAFSIFFVSRFPLFAIVKIIVKNGVTPPQKSCLVGNQSKS